MQNVYFLESIYNNASVLLNLISKLLKRCLENEINLNERCKTKHEYDMIGTVQLITLVITHKTAHIIAIYQLDY